MSIKYSKLFSVVIFLSLAACGKQSGTEYIGHWTNIKDTRSAIEIASNGENFIVKVTRPNLMTQNIQTQNMSGIIKDGTLAIPNGIGDSILNIDKSNGHIISEYGEFEKK